jgi:hypothetical protein
MRLADAGHRRRPNARAGEQHLFCHLDGVPPGRYKHVPIELKHDSRAASATSPRLRGEVTELAARPNAFSRRFVCCWGVMQSHRNLMFNEDRVL